MRTNTSLSPLGGRPETTGRVRRRQHITRAGIAGVISLIGLPLLFSGSTSASAARLDVRRGDIGDGQSVAALDVQDQFGQDDDWTKYIEFSPDGRRHVSIITASAHGVGTEAIEIDVNYRGPNSRENRWTLQIRDRDARRWINVFDNDGVPNWAWDESTTELTDPERFVNAAGQVKLRYRSSNGNDVSQLDHVSVMLTGSTTPSTTTPPTTTPTTTTPPTTTPPTTTPPTTAPPTTVPPPPVGLPLPTPNAGFDYQIGGDYAVPPGVASVSRDWFIGTPAPGLYNVCYVNAFQTQDNEPGVDRPDELDNWPADLVLTGVADDPNWGGEYLVDISTPAKRDAAATHLQQMIQGCADKGFDAVEFDNLDSWTRFEDFPDLQAQIPFDRTDTIAFATTITQRAHDLGLAVAQKNTSDFVEDATHLTVGFDFAIAEECGVYSECATYVDGYGDNVLVTEYNDSPENIAGFATACAGFGDRLSIVIRDRNVVTPSDPDYFRDDC